MKKRTSFWNDFGIHGFILLRKLYRHSIGLSPRVLLWMFGTGRLKVFFVRFEWSQHVPVSSTFNNTRLIIIRVANRFVWHMLPLMTFLQLLLTVSRFSCKTNTAFSYREPTERAEYVFKSCRRLSFFIKTFIICFRLNVWFTLRYPSLPKHTPLYHNNCEVSHNNASRWIICYSDRVTAAKSRTQFIMVAKSIRPQILLPNYFCQVQIVSKLVIIIIIVHSFFSLLECTWGCTQSSLFSFSISWEFSRVQCASSFFKPFFVWFFFLKS